MGPPGAQGTLALASNVWSPHLCLDSVGMNFLLINSPSFLFGLTSASITGDGKSCRQLCPAGHTEVTARPEDGSESRTPEWKQGHPCGSSQHPTGHSSWEQNGTGSKEKGTRTRAWDSQAQSTESSLSLHTDAREVPRSS